MPADLPCTQQHNAESVSVVTSIPCNSAAFNHVQTARTDAGLHQSTSVALCDDLPATSMHTQLTLSPAVGRERACITRAPRTTWSWCRPHLDSKRGCMSKSEANPKCPSMSTRLLRCSFTHCALLEQHAQHPDSRGKRSCPRLHPWTTLCEIGRSMLIQVLCMGTSREPKNAERCMRMHHMDAGVQAGVQR